MVYWKTDPGEEADPSAKVTVWAFTLMASTQKVALFAETVISLVVMVWGVPWAEESWKTPPVRSMFPREKELLANK